jgi:hypothetical protein
MKYAVKRKTSFHLVLLLTPYCILPTHDVVAIGPH